VGEGIGQAELRGGVGAPTTGAEEPDLGTARHFRLNEDAIEGMLLREAVVEKGEHLNQTLREVIAAALVYPLQGVRLERCPTGRPADAEVYAVGVERVEHAEALGDLQRAVMRQQHGAGADADRFCLGADSGEQYLGRRAGERTGRVVLSDPEAFVAQALSEPCKVEGVS
jgi:hypothetical protein